MTRRLTVTRPDDWHLHLRDGEMMRAVLPFSAELYGRALVMPNLSPPVRTPADARAYRARIRAALPGGHPFQPLMTAYLSDDTDPAGLAQGFAEGLFHAVKLYPAGATTNSRAGVTDFERVHRAIEVMERIDMPLSVHGEVVDSSVDIFDREAVFVETVLDPLRRRFPGLRVVLEHVTTREAVDYVREAAAGLAATITPHHLAIDRNALFEGGLRPHMYCLPVAKRASHRRALRAAAVSGDSRFFLGTDSAPHPRSAKESDCGCAGIFNAPNALACVATVFDEEGALQALEAFTAHSGADFYRMPRNADSIVLEEALGSAPQPEAVAAGGESVRIFAPPAAPGWKVVEGLRPLGRPPARDDTIPEA